MEDIEKLTKAYADARERLAGTIDTLQGRTETLRRQYLPAIKVQVRIARERQAALKEAIEESADLFKRPRTIIMYGIRVGFGKGKGEIRWANGDMVVRLIEKHYPEQADILIKTTKTPLKKALANLPVAELKRIGVTVGKTGDEVIIRPVDSDIDKLVAALLKDEDEETIADEVA